MCVWHNGYQRRKWNRQTELKYQPKRIRSLCVNTFGKGMRPLRGKIVEHTELSNLGRATSLRDSEFTYIKERWWRVMIA